MTHHSDTDRGLGVLAFGDSITHGGGELQWGVALQSWALWVARAAGLPFTSYAVDGARAADVVGEQIPGFLSRTADPDARYELGCLYIGVNDMRALDWGAGQFERDFNTALRFLGARCYRVLTITAPLDLGRPRAGARVAECNRIIERSAGPLGVLIVDLSGLKARNLLMPDHVHLTAFGQIALAERALDVLEENGMRVVVRPKSLIAFVPTRRGRLQGDATYVYRHTKVTTQAVLQTARARLQAARPSTQPGRLRRGP